MQSPRRTYIQFMHFSRHQSRPQSGSHGGLLDRALQWRIRDGTTAHRNLDDLFGLTYQPLVQRRSHTVPHRNDLRRGMWGTSWLLGMIFSSAGHLNPSAHPQRSAS